MASVFEPFTSGGIRPGNPDLVLEAVCPDTLILLADIACRTWYISSRLMKLQPGNYTRRANIQSYARRLEDHSTLFLSVVQTVRHKIFDQKHGPLFGLSTKSHLQGYILQLGFFNALIYAVTLHNEDPSRMTPVISYHVLSNHPVPSYVKVHGDQESQETFEPFSEAGHAAIQNSLRLMEISAARVVSSLIYELGLSSPAEFDLSSQVFIKLGIACNDINEEQNQKFIRRRILYFNAGIYLWQVVQPSIGIPMQVKASTFKLRILEAPNRNLTDEIFSTIPDFKSLRLLAATQSHVLSHVAPHSFDLLRPEYPGTWGYSGALTISDRIEVTGDLWNVSFEDPEFESAAGVLLLGADCLVACEQGRLKRKRALLFEHRLMLLRPKSTGHEVVYDVPRRDFILVTYRKRDKGPGSVMVFWDAEPDGPHEVVGVEMCFDSFYEHRIWAGFLALTVEPKTPEI